MAIRMYMAGLIGKRVFTKAHAKAILLFAFESSPATSRTKPNLIEDLKVLEEKDPDCLIEAAEQFVDVDGPSKNIATIDTPTDNGPPIGNIVAIPAVNDAPAFNYAAILSERICMYLANETNKIHTNPLCKYSCILKSWSIIDSWDCNNITNGWPIISRGINCGYIPKQAIAIHESLSSLNQTIQMLFLQHFQVFN